MKKKTLAVISAFILLLPLLSGISFAEHTPFGIAVGEETGNVGDVVPVKIVISDNPGIISINMTMTFDTEKLELCSIEDGGILGTEVMHKNSEKTSPFAFSWANYTTDQATKQTFNENGVLCTMNFRIKKAESGEKIPISLSLPDYAVMDFDLNDVPTEAKNGSITVGDGGVFNEDSFPTVPVVIGAVVLVAFGIATYFIFIRKKEK